ncbi:MAG: polysaccharide biosynthesis tyrosine autokinase [Acidobacteriaceae bacterium]
MRKEEIQISDEGVNGDERRLNSSHAVLPAVARDAPDSGPSLSQYLWVIKRHRWHLLAFVIFSVVATVIISKRLTPLYESTAVIDIDRQTPAAVLGNENNPAVNSVDAENYLTTQEQIVKSDAVLRPVVEKYHLLTEAQQKLAGDKILSSRLQDAPIELKGLKITRPLHTFLLLISYRSPDPQLSADVVNDIARSYIRHTYDIRYQAASQMTGYMEKQLEELKAKMERSAAALANLEKDLDVINPEEKTNVFSARLLHLDNDLTAAEVDRAGKEAAYNAVKSGSLPAAEASDQGEQLRALEVKLNEANEKFAEIQTQFGSTHPIYKRAASEVTALQSEADELRQRIVQRVSIDYQQAENRESLLRQEMTRAKGEFDQTNARSFEYKALKQEADTDKALYEELIRKIREAGINASFESSSIRLADVARPALYPSFPRTRLNALLALLGSTIIGLSIIFLMDALDTTVVDSDHLQRELRVALLPSLPVGKFSAGLLPLQDLPGDPDESFPTLAAKDALAASNGAFDEAIRKLRSSILLSAGLGQQPRSLLVTSASPGEGKSTIALYLAAAHSLQQRRTLLIDGDMRRPVIKLGVSNDRGLSDVVNGTMHWKEAIQTPYAYPDLDVLSAGPSSRRVADRIGSVLRSILDEAEREYDLVVIDSPPLLGFAEPLEIAALADGVIIVARAGRTNRTAIASVAEQLKRVRANVIGIVLNGVRADMSSQYYYYSPRYYSHYQRDDR